MPDVNISTKNPIEISLNKASDIRIDVTNKAINLGSLSAENIATVLGFTPASDTYVDNSIDEKLSNIFNITSVKSGDTLIHNGTSFANRPKEELSDGGNF